MPLFVRSIVLVLLFAILTLTAGRPEFVFNIDRMVLRLDSVFVLLAGAVLGARLGALSMVAYFVIALGLGPLIGKYIPGLLPPVYGIGYLTGAQAGNILAFPVAAYVVGSITQNRREYQRTFLAMLLGLGILYWFQAVWFTYVSTGTLIQSAVLWVAPFLFFDTLKVAVASLFAPLLAGLVDRVLERTAIEPAGVEEFAVAEEPAGAEPAYSEALSEALEPPPGRASGELGPASERT